MMMCNTFGQGTPVEAHRS